MVSFPKCTVTPKCGTIAYMVRKKGANPLRHDMFICENCMATAFCGEDCEPIPKMEPIYECLQSAEFNIKEITRFKDQHKLHIMWDGLNGELNSFKESLLQLKFRLSDIKDNKQWNLLVDFQTDARAFLDIMLDSKLMRYYCREQQFRSFQDFKSGSSIQTRDTQKFLRSKLADFQKSVQTNQIAPLQSKLDEATQEALLAKTQLHATAQENTRLQQEVQDLTQSANEQQELVSRLNQRIQTMVDEEVKLNMAFEEVKKEMSELEQTLERSKCKISYGELKSIHNAILGKTDNFQASSEFIFNLKEDLCINLCKALQLYRLPPLNSVLLDNIEKFSKPEVLNRFIENALSEDIKMFKFYCRNSSCIKITDYVTSFKKALPKIPNKADILWFQMSKSEFEDIIVAAKNCKQIEIDRCKIDTKQELHFGDRLNESSFTTLFLGGVGGSSYSNWSQDDFLQFKNIIKGLAKVEQVKNRAIKLNLKDCDLTKEKAESILQESGMTNITLEGL
ncbi:unnamed protein product [Moneuplotes crassus]|uniref:Uncharacterized protein n=1 Tax=Euplotes crassus TaxID=5936 RepID=A0AAD1U3R9_EUPCR|nr:unnamed protein product [Moneuplotes crassus]